MIAGIVAVATLELDVGRTKDGVLVVLTVNDLGVADRLGCRRPHHRLPGQNAIAPDRQGRGPVRA
jgi:hypothetical protein